MLQATGYETHERIIKIRAWKIQTLASDRRGSNPRSRPWQGRALPTTPLSHKAGDGNRTHVSSLEGWCSTIELHPHNAPFINLLSPEEECPVPESNQRHEDFQSSALPTELTRLAIPRIIYRIDDFKPTSGICQVIK